MSGQQFNVPLAERYAVALRQLALRDDRSVPETLRPAVEAFLEHELEQDRDLATAVEALLRSRQRRQPPAPVSELGQARVAKRSPT
jgi:hypothetical protein